MQLCNLYRFFGNSRFRSVNDVMKFVAQKDYGMNFDAQADLVEYLQSNYGNLDVNNTVSIADLIFINTGYFKYDTVFQHLQHEFTSLSTSSKVKLLHIIAKQKYPIAMFRQNYTADLSKTLQEISTDHMILGVYIISLSKILQFTPQEEEAILSSINKVKDKLNPKHIINLISNSKGSLQEQLVDILTDTLIDYAKQDKIIREFNTKNHTDFIH